MKLLDLGTASNEGRSEGAPPSNWPLEPAFYSVAWNFFRAREDGLSFGARIRFQGQKRGVQLQTGGAQLACGLAQPLPVIGE